MTIQSHESFKGVIVGEVVPGSVADSRGVLVGDMILAVCVSSDSCAFCIVIAVRLTADPCSQPPTTMY